MKRIRTDAQVGKRGMHPVFGEDCIFEETAVSVIGYRCFYMGLAKRTASTQQQAARANLLSVWISASSSSYSRW